jgi:hypothetical protein
MPLKLSVLAQSKRKMMKLLSILMPRNKEFCVACLSRILYYVMVLSEPKTRKNSRPPFCVREHRSGTVAD